MIWIDPTLSQKHTHTTQLTQRYHLAFSLSLSLTHTYIPPSSLFLSLSLSHSHTHHSINCVTTTLLFQVGVWNTKLEFSDVYAMGHADANASSIFVQINLQSTEPPYELRMVELSPLHFAITRSASGTPCIMS